MPLLSRLALTALVLALPAAASAGDRIAELDLIDHSTKADSVILRTHSAVAGSVSSASVDVIDASGKRLESVSMKRPVQSKVVLEGGAAKVGNSLVLSIELPVLDEKGSATGKRFTDKVSLSSISTTRAKVSGGGGYTYTFWIRPRGQVAATVSHDSGAWRGSSLGAAKVQIGEVSSELELLRVVDRWRTTLTTDLAKHASLDLQASLSDAKGGALATHAETVFTDTDEAHPVTARQAVRETNKGAVRVVADTRDAGGEVAAVEIEVEDLDTGKLVLDQTVKAPRAVSRRFYAPLSFEDAPDGEVYQVLIDLIDADDKPVGEQIAAEITAPSTLTTEVTDSLVRLGDTDLSNLSLWHGPDDGWGLVLDWAGADADAISSVEISFEEPFEGPAPTEVAVTMDLIVETEEWVSTGTAGLPDSYSVTTRLLGADGGVLSEVQSGGSEPGVSYKNKDPKPKKKLTGRRQQKPLTISKEICHTHGPICVPIKGSSK